MLAVTGTGIKSEVGRIGIGVEIEGATGTAVVIETGAGIEIVADETVDRVVEIEGGTGRNRRGLTIRRVVRNRVVLAAALTAQRTVVKRASGGSAIEQPS